MIPQRVRVNHVSTIAISEAAAGSGSRTAPVFGVRRSSR